MNPTEQRLHRTATRELAQGMELIAEATAERLAAVETKASVLGTRLREQADTCRAAVGEERTARLTLANEQRGYVDARDRDLSLRLARFERLTVPGWRGFWCRLKWLLVAR